MGATQSYGNWPPGPARQPPPERAAIALSKLAVYFGADPAEAESIRGRILDPSTRRTTARALSDRARIPDIAIAAWLSEGNDSAAIAALEQAVDGALFDRIYLGQTVSLLGPALTSHPRVQSAIKRYIQRLRRERQR